MKPDQYTERLVKVRVRFMRTLAGKIDDTYAALPQLASASARLDTIDETYRRIHAISGVGPTIGFGATGRTAAALEATIVAPYRARRALTEDEFVRFKQALQALREAAFTELQTAQDQR